MVCLPFLYHSLFTIISIWKCGISLTRYTKELLAAGHSAPPDDLLDLVEGTSGFSGNDFGQVVYTRASVTKQYNLVPVAGQRCPGTGKVTVGLASHWPCVTDLNGLSTHGLTA